MRPTAVFRGGEWIPTDIVAGPNGYPSRPSPPARGHIISDQITCEHTRRNIHVRSEADGRMYDSKSRIRAEHRARRLDEVGNDPQGKKPSDTTERQEKQLKTIHDDVQRAWSLLGGYA